MTRNHRTGNLHTASGLRHTDSLWSALAAAISDDDDPRESRRRLAALRLHQPSGCC